MRPIATLIFLTILMASTVYAQDIRVRERLRPMFEFDHVGNFKNGLAVVLKGNEIAVVDTNGEFIIPFRRNSPFNRLVDFSYGLIPLYDAQSSLFGFYNTRGEQVINYHFIDARQFSERLAAVFYGYGWGFVDASGQIIIYPEYTLVSDFNNGIATVYIEETGEFGFIDTYGNNIVWLESPRAFRRGLHHAQLPQFSEGLIAFGITVDSGRIRYGYMDTAGNIVIPPTFYSASSFSEGRASVWVEGRAGTAGIIDKNGNLIMLPRARWIARFSEGRAVFSTGVRDVTEGFIDTYGNEIIAPVFIYAFNFSEGLAAVRTDDGWGFIDMYGNKIIAPSFEAVTSFSEGFAWVLQDGKWGILQIYDYERSTVVNVITTMIIPVFVMIIIAYIIILRMVLSYIELAQARRRL